jgi:hypothetical protein
MAASKIVQTVTKAARAAKKKRKGALPGGGQRKAIEQALSNQRVRNATKKTGSPINVKQKGDDVASDKIDHRSGGDVNVAEQVGTRGEKVSQGSGDRAMSYPAEQSTKASRNRAKKYTQAQARVRKGNPKKGDKEFIARYDAEESERSTRAAQKGARTRAAGSRKRIDKKFEEKAEKSYINDGVIEKHPITKKDYDPPSYIKRRAERNADARAKRPEQRQIEALKESKKTGGQIKGYSRSKARPKGVGAAQRGWGKTGKH